MSGLKPLPSLNTAPIFLSLHGELLSLLQSLEPADWERPTIAGAWRVRDVAAHLLDGDLRKLASHRDGHALSAGPPPGTYADVVRLIGRLNAEGVAFGARLSPRVLTDLLEVSGRWVSAFVAALDPDAPALFPVAWAGEARSDNRLDTAREYSERWHHQMQIRVAAEARGRPEVLLAPIYFESLLDTSVRALPHAYRALSAPDGTSVVLQQAGAAPREWTLLREDGGWRLYSGSVARPDARVSGEPDVLWRLFFNALSEAAALSVLTIDGPAQFILPLLRARSVMV